MLVNVCVLLPSLPVSTDQPYSSDVVQAEFYRMHMHMDQAWRISDCNSEYKSVYQREREREKARGREGRQREEGGRRHEGEREGRLYSVSTVLVAQFVCAFRFNPGTHNSIRVRVRMQTTLSLSFKQLARLTYMYMHYIYMYIYMCNPCI